MQLVMTNGLEMVLVPRGIKRPAEDSLEKEQRLAKRLSLLSLGSPPHTHDALQVTYADIKGQEIHYRFAHRRRQLSRQRSQMTQTR